MNVEQSVHPPPPMERPPLPRPLRGPKQASEAARNEITRVMRTKRSFMVDCFGFGGDPPSSGELGAVKRVAL